jgi:hypothetical protein
VSLATICLRGCYGWQTRARSRFALSRDAASTARLAHLAGSRLRSGLQRLTSPTQAATLAHEIAYSLLQWTAEGDKVTTRDGKEIGTPSALVVRARLRTSKPLNPANLPAKETDRIFTMQLPTRNVTVIQSEKP